MRAPASDNTLRVEHESASGEISARRPKKHDAAGAWPAPAAVQGTRIAVARRSQSSPTAHTPRAHSAMHCCHSLLLQGIGIRRRRDAASLVGAASPPQARAAVGGKGLRQARAAPRARRPPRAD